MIDKMWSELGELKGEGDRVLSVFVLDTPWGRVGGARLAVDGYSSAVTNDHVVY